MAKSISSIHALDLVDQQTFSDRAANGDLLFCSSLGKLGDAVEPFRPSLWDHVGMIWYSPENSGWLVLSNEDGISRDPLRQYLKRCGGSLAFGPPAFTQ